MTSAVPCQNVFVLCYADQIFHLRFEVFRCCVLNVKVISVDV